MKSKKLMIALVLTLLLAGLVTNAALAFDCNNPNIDDNAVVGVFDVATETFTPNKSNWGTFDSVHGAWIKLVFPWGDSYNIFVKSLLPDGARNAGPGDDGCDGKGIDDLDVCLAMLAP
ncbi:MAG: hypothetical protein ACK2UW_06365 [Anaerolineales bacterium]|jgi:uncharacterized membrane protein